MGETSLVDEVEQTIRQAAGGQAVTRIRLAVGREVSVSKMELAKELHKRFPQASVELSSAKEADAVLVRDIDVG